jgi:hypothetical protein
VSITPVRWTVGISIAIALTIIALPPLTWHPLTVVGLASQRDLTRVSGVVHVHTSLSDGRGTPESVIDAAKAAGIDFVVITDHNEFPAKRLEGYAGRVLVIVGTEISTRSGHILAFGLPEPTFRFSDDASEVLDDIRYLGGVAVIAHPDNRRQDFRWTQWDAPGPWGIEILNGDTEWRSMGWVGTARLLAAYPLNPTYALLRALGRPDSTLDRWDRLSSRRNTAIVAGADAHGFPSYESLFGLAQNHVLLDRAPSGHAVVDSSAIVAALQRGRAYVGIDGLAPTGGFTFVAEQGAMRWTMGDVVPATPRPLLRAGGLLPEGARVFLFRDGRPLRDAPGQLEWRDAAAGVYRVEVRLPGWDVPWILSNPIYVFDSAEREARRTRESAPTSVVPVGEILENFEGDSSFEAVSDDSTDLDGNIIVPQSGRDGGSAARLRFRLGTPTASTPSPFAALVSLRDRDLSRHRGLVLSIKGDRPRRVWVQVRDQNPNSEGGTEWWYASVRTTADWERVAVPFERFRSRDARTDGRLNLESTRGVLFIVDIGAMAPGTEAAIWIDDVGLY